MDGSSGPGGKSAMYNLHQPPSFWLIVGVGFLSFMASWPHGTAEI